MTSQPPDLPEIPRPGNVAAPSAVPPARWGWARLGRLALLVGIAAVAVGLAGGGRWLQGRWERDRGMGLVRNGQFAAAEPLLRDVLARNPSDLEVVQALARAAMAEDRVIPAVEYLSRWAELRPNDVEPFERRMAVHVRLKWFRQSIADARRVLELAPYRDDVRQKLAGWLMEAGEFPEAERECRRCLERRPDHPELVYLLAQIYHKQGQNDRAVPLLDALLRDFPGEGTIAFLRGIVAVELGRPGEAVPLLEGVLAQDPGNERARAYLVTALARLGQTEKAQRIAAAGREGNPP